MTSVSTAFSAFLQTPELSDVNAITKGMESSTLNGFIHRELSELQDELRRRNVEVHPFHPSNLGLVQGSLPSADTFVAGDLGVMSRLLDDLGLADRIVGSYPSALDPLLHRQTWRTSRRELQRSQGRTEWPIFAKPLRIRIFEGKRCRGRILTNDEAVRQWERLPLDEPLLCSEVVGWISEYRCFVMNSRIVGIHPYRVLGTPVYRVDCAALEALLPDIRPSVEFVEDAIAELDGAGQSVAGYCLDFGFSTLGKMSLIEMNDGLCLLNYGIEPKQYLDLHMARWRELMTMCAPRAHSVATA